jgi:hypothetical protein
MKTIRSLMTLAGLILAAFALSATGAYAQSISTPIFSGTFTLPVAAQWGGMTLPAGEYNLSYGLAFAGGTRFIEVASKKDGTTRGLVVVTSNSDPSTSKDALVCIREGDALVVRMLEMPSIGTSAQFSMPHGAQLVARNAKHNGYTQIAEAPKLFEQIPVTLNAK